MTEFNEENTNQTIERLALRSQAPIEVPGGENVLIIPHGHSVEGTDKFSIRPMRLKRKLQVTTAESYVEYFEAFKVAASRHYADLDAVTIRGVLDDHEGATLGEARWCEHWVTYTCPFSREWQAWMANDRTRMNQLDFAHHLEDRQSEITSPPGSELLDIALQLEVKRDVSYRSVTRLETGELSFAYAEENAAGGAFAIPAEFELGIPVFRSGQVYKITVRLRYHLTSGRLELWYEIVDPDKYIEDAFGTVCAEIQSKTEAPMFEATL